MPRFNVLVLCGGLLGYLVSILASTALVLLFFRLNSRLLPGQKVTALLTGDSKEGMTAPAIALGAAILSQAYLLRHVVFTVMTLVQDFLLLEGSGILAGRVPFLACLKLLALSALLMAALSALAVLSVWIAGWLFNRMTRGIDEIQEIATGNVPVAILFAFVLFSITAILNEGFEDVSRVLVPYSRSGVVRLP